MNIQDLPLPQAFIQLITGTDAQHYGYWSENEQHLTLSQAQSAHLQILFKQFPEIPSRILDVGCGLGLMADELHQMGHQVTAIASSKRAIAYAQEKHPGPDYINAHFLDEHQALQSKSFDVILFNESLHDFSDLEALFKKAGALLAENGRLIICDTVLYNNRTKQPGTLHTPQLIEKTFFSQGFYIQQHETSGMQTAPTCKHVLHGLQRTKQQLIELFGPAAEQQTEQLISQWQNLHEAGQMGHIGYELWQLRFSPYKIRAYQINDELLIIEQFNQVFQTHRSIKHWQWKYLNNPQGGPCISIAWDKKQLASHYSAYPLALTHNGQNGLTYQVGDTFTLPAWRGVGRGKTNLLSRVVRHFHKSWCEGQIDFFYGFNTGRIQKLGKRFLFYVPVAPVNEYFLSSQQCTTNQYTRLKRRLKGYRIELVEQSAHWADDLFAKAQQDYVMLISRSRAYMQWRYDQHPDFDYQYILLKQWDQVVGWCVIRKQEQTLLLIDVLCMQQHRSQLVNALQEVLKNMPECTELSGWFSDTPGWWREELLKSNFSQRRQFQNLDLCATLFSSQLSAADLKNEFYFTMGDSDLY